jgi:hypothetical protein
LAASWLFFLSFAEIALAIFLKDPAQMSRYDPVSDTTANYMVMTDIGVQPRSGVHRFKKLTAAGDVIYDVTYTIGSDGFRVADNPDARNRVNFFGCSFTFGEGLNDNETLPYLVSKTMEGVSSKNFGFHGYGPHQALAILQSDRDTRGKINFLLTAPWQAPRSACAPEFSQGSAKFELHSDGSLVRAGNCRIYYGNTSFFEDFVRNSGIYKFINALIERSNQDHEFNLYLKIIEEMQNISHERGQKFVIGFIRASDGFFAGSYTNERLYDKLSQVSDKIVDLSLAPSEESLAREFYINALDRHPTAKANEERAKILRNIFQEYWD